MTHIEEYINEIMSEAHDMPYTRHLGSTKMYRDLKQGSFIEWREKRCSIVCGTMFDLSAS